jgi:hypothetical protein
LRAFCFLGERKICAEFAGTQRALRRITQEGPFGRMAFRGERRYGDAVCYGDCGGVGL